MRSKTQTPVFMPFWHTIPPMDLVAACRVFVHVGERGSVTLGAAAARVPQSVASRRIAALERHLGERLFDRSTRRTALTAFGRDLLPSAKRLVALAEALEHDAEQAKLRPLALAVPDTCSVRQCALLEGAAREHGAVLEFRTAAPAERAALASAREVRAALIAVPPDEGSWVVPLGVATAKNTGTRALHLDTLRPSRTQEARRIWLQPEDDVPHVRDRLEHLGHRAALLPAQLTVATSLTAAVSDVLRTDNLLLGSAAQAHELDLHWRPLAGTPVSRGYAMTGDEADRLKSPLWTHIAKCLGAQPKDETR
jgi:DNA-binding transcriptional LysR family regulator